MIVQEIQAIIHASAVSIKVYSTRFDWQGQKRGKDFARANGMGEGFSKDLRIA